MRGVGRKGLAAALVLGLAVSVAVAQDRDNGSKPAAAGWWSGWFGGQDKPEARKAGADRPSPGPSVVERAEAVRQRELKNYLRRIDVCDRLAQIAEDANDQQMVSQVEELKERVWAVYQQRSGRLAPGATPETEDAPAQREATSRKPAAGRAREDKP
jgi:hypothetical protein